MKKKQHFEKIRRRSNIASAYIPFNGESIEYMIFNNRPAFAAKTLQNFSPILSSRPINYLIIDPF
jgi:hypothetical protein